MYVLRKNDDITYLEILQFHIIYNHTKPINLFVTINGVIE